MSRKDQETQTLAIVNFDSNGKILAVNRRFMSLFGCNEDVLGKQVESLFQEGKRDLDGTVTGILKDGTTLKMNARAVAPSHIAKTDGVHVSQAATGRTAHSLQLWATEEPTHHRHTQLKDATIGHYLIREFVSCTDDACVYEAIDTRDKKPVMLKAYEKATYPAHQWSLVHNEIDVMRNLTEAADRWSAIHPGVPPPIARLLEVVDTPQLLCLVMEQAGRSLEAEIETRGPLPEDEVKQIAVKLLRALQWLRMHGIAHLNVNPATVLVSRTEKPLPHEDVSPAHALHYPLYQPQPRCPTLDQTLTVRLCGFSSARFSRSDKHRHFLPSKHYAAPEMHHGDAFYGPEADVWSAAAVLCAALTGRTWHDDIAAAATNGAQSQECRAFLQRVLHADSDHRPTVETLLRDAWLQALVSPVTTPTKTQSSIASQLSAVAVD